MRSRASLGKSRPIGGGNDSVFFLYARHKKEHEEEAKTQKSNFADCVGNHVSDKNELTFRDPFDGEFFNTFRSIQ
jgi:hypothetical protein